MFWATKRITSPIQKLTDLTSNIEKVHKIEEIREKVKDHELFKKFQKEDYEKTKNQNQDEIQELISIFYNFFIQDTEEQEENNMMKKNQYEYPSNLYYEPSEGKRKGSHFEKNS